MFGDHRPQGEKQETLSRSLTERHLPGLYRYVMYRTGDAALAESLTVKTLRKTLTGSADCDNEGTWTVTLFSAACKELQKYGPIGTPPVFTGLSPLERDALALRLGARLDVRMISKVLQISPSAVRAVMYRSLCKMTPGVKDGISGQNQ